MSKMACNAACAARNPSLDLYPEVLRTQINKINAWCATRSEEVGSRVNVNGGQCMASYMVSVFVRIGLMFFSCCCGVERGLLEMFPLLLVACEACESFINLKSCL